MQNLQQNEIIQPLLTDLYQITMAYAYWKSAKTSDYAVFEVFFRKNPFGGEFTIFAGLEECLKFLEKFSYSESDIIYLKMALGDEIDEGFYDYLRTVTAKDITVYAMREGSVCFPKVPLLRIEGPLIMIQLLETTFLTLINYASLVATNAARYRMAAGSVDLLEFGLRKAQGPDGGLSASKYCYIGGFDGTSNVLAGKLYDIPLRGTPAHGYVASFDEITEMPNVNLIPKNGGQPKNLSYLSMNWRTELLPIFQIVATDNSHDAELAALVSFAVAFPNTFMASVDTFHVKRYPTSVTLSNSHNEYRSSLLNFSAVALALDELGYRPLGIRIDSGDLAHISKIAQNYFNIIAIRYNRQFFNDLLIMAANDINEETIYSLNEQEHKINCFGIGTSLVTCQRQPALGGVCKMVELNDHPRIKLSQDVGKVTIPAKKNVFRLFGQNGLALVDLMQKADEEPPESKIRVLCRHPFDETKRAFVIPNRVENLLKPYWQNGKIYEELPCLREVRKYAADSLKTLRTDIKRNLNPTPYKVAVSNNLYNYLHEVWMQNAPIGELS